MWYQNTHTHTHTFAHTHACTHTHTHTLAHRVSVDAVEEELGEWRKEVDQLREMVSQSNEMQLGEDFVSQLDQFLPVSKSPTLYLFLAHFLLRALSLPLTLSPPTGGGCNPVISAGSAGHSEREGQRNGSIFL